MKAHFQFAIPQKLRQRTTIKTPWRCHSFCIATVAKSTPSHQSTQGKFTEPTGLSCFLHPHVLLSLSRGRKMDQRGCRPKPPPAPPAWAGNKNNFLDPIDLFKLAPTFFAMLKWFLLFTGVLGAGLAALAQIKGWKALSVIFSAYGALALSLFGGGWIMANGIQIRQTDVNAEKNTGMEVKEIPPQGVQLPPINIQQERITAKENTGLSFSYNPHSGPVRLDSTQVVGDEGSVTIAPNAVTINPSAGSVKFLHRK